MLDNEEKKKYLSGYQESKRAVRRLEEELEELKETGSKMEKRMLQQDIKEKIIKERDRQIERYEEVRRQVECMNDEREKDALIYKYIIGLTEDAAAKRMGYTKRQFQRINKKALENFELKCR